MSFGIGGGAHLTPLGENRAAAGSSHHRMQSWLRRRLEDSIEDVFHAALQRGDIAAATDLLGVMENIHARARVRFNAERRGTAQMIERCRKELEGRRVRHRLPPA